MKNSLEDIFSAYESYRNTAVFSGKPETLYQSMQYIMDLGGKRARPMLTIAAAISAGGSIESALPLAHLHEVFHNFSLVHDDIMDNADSRRGKPTVHVKWNIPTAILAGDNMLVSCFQVLQAYNGPNRNTITDIFTKTAVEVCEGQQMDMDFATAKLVTEQQYLEMIRLKTAVLLGCCAANGALSAGCDTDKAQLYYDFAIALGLAFQLMDDYLDTFGQSENTGKIQGGDIAEGKKTWLFIASENLSDEVTAIYQQTEKGERIDKATRLFLNQKLDKELLALSNHYHDVAIEKLGKIRESGDDTQPLEALMLFLENRKN